VTATGETGSVTAEFAIALPAVIVVLGACLGGLSLAGQYVRVQDAAAAAAREAGRGDTAAVATRLVPGASTAQWAEGDLVCVRVTGTGSLGMVPVPLSATSCALGAGE
jgi:Flp pilus assembly protein TadG